MVDATAKELQERTQGHRILSLDALRGLAAFTVVWHHLRLVFFSGEPRWYLRPLFAGHAAVILFFVLSGYVLSLPIWRGSLPPYGQYISRRFFRIYVPYAAAVVLQLALEGRLHGFHPPLTEWFVNSIPPRFTGLMAAREFLTLFPPVLMTAFWTLRYEFEMSILFPAICRAARRMGPLGTLAATVLLAKAGLMIGGHMSFPWISEIGMTTYYGSCFLLGAWMAWQRVPLAEWYRRAPRLLKILVLALALYAAYFEGKDFTLMFAAGSAILFAQDRRVSRALEHRIPEYLGRISYSLYLIHDLVLVTAFCTLYGRIPTIGIVAIYIACTFGLSHLFCILVEEPSMHLGKRVTRQTRLSLGGGHQAG